MICVTLNQVRLRQTRRSCASIVLVSASLCKGIVALPVASSYVDSSDRNSVGLFADITRVDGMKQERLDDSAALCKEGTHCRHPVHILRHSLMSGTCELLCLEKSLEQGQLFVGEDHLNDLLCPVETPRTVNIDNVLFVSYESLEQFCVADVYGPVEIS